MPEEVKRKRGRPPKNKVENVVETNSTVETSTTDSTYEFSTYSAIGISEYYFGLDIFNIYSPKEISDMVESPMVHNHALRKLSNKLYSSKDIPI